MGVELVRQGTAIEPTPMRRLTATELRPLLQCPCGGRLIWPSDRPRCAECRRDYPLVGGKPALVRLEASVIEPPTAGNSVSPIIRPTPVRAWISRLVFGGSPRSSTNMARLASRLSQQADPVVLVVGGAERGFGHDELDDVDGLMMSFDVYDTQLVDFLADGHEIPLRDETVDAVVVQAVLEHVLEPHTVVAELHRVLRDGGFVYAETPFMQQVHEGAYDFTRFTERGHRWLFREFSQLDSGALRGAGTALLWSIRYFLASLIGNKRVAGLLCLPLAWLRLLDRFARPGFEVDSACDVYFLGQKSAHAMLGRKELIDGYQGAQR